MIIVNSDNGTNAVGLIPRFYPVSDINVEILKELNETKDIINTSYIISNGSMILSLDYVFEDGFRYEFKVKEGLDTVFVGKFLAKSLG